MHPNRQFPAHFVVHMPSCLHVLFWVARPLHCDRRGRGNCHLGYVPSGVRGYRCAWAVQGGGEYGPPSVACATAFSNVCHLSCATAFSNVCHLSDRSFVVDNVRRHTCEPVVLGIALLFYACGSQVCLPLPSASERSPLLCSQRDVWGGFWVRIPWLVPVHISWWWSCICRACSNRVTCC